MKKYLVVGASGLIGSHLTQKLAENNTVYGVSRKVLTYAHPNLLWFQHDLVRPLSSCDLPKDLDAIIYLAQSEHFREFPEKTLALFDVNVVRYLELLDFAVKNGIKQVLYASSGGVYEQCGTPFREEDKLSISGSLGFYFGSKLCAEILSNAYSKALNAQILRFFFVYGPGQRPDMLIPRLLNSVKQRMPIKLDNESGIKINPIHVDDAVEAIISVLAIPNSEIYNVAGEQIYTIRAISEKMGELLKIDPIFEVNHKPESTIDIIGNILKLKETGWLPKINLDHGLMTLLPTKLTG